MNRVGVPAVFLDRDGVINRKRPGDYVKSWAEFEFLPGALEALAGLAAINVPVVVVTNQAGVGKGLMTLSDLEGIHGTMLRAIRDAGGRVDAIYACPHRPENACECRKPKPGLLVRAARELGIDLCRSYVVGDSVTDVQAAWLAGCKAILVDPDGRDTVHGEADQGGCRDILIPHASPVVTGVSENFEAPVPGFAGKHYLTVRELRDTVQLLKTDPEFKSHWSGQSPLSPWP